MVDVSEIEGKDIQLEYGNWSQLHNHILMSLAASNLSGIELRAVLFLIRETYGFKKKETDIPLSEWCEALHTKNKRQIMNVLAGLVTKRVIGVTDGGRRGSKIYGFNKYVEEWAGVFERDASRADRFKGSSGITVDTATENGSGITVDTATGITADTGTGHIIKKGKEDIQMPFSLVDDETGEVVAKYNDMPAVPSVKARKPRAAKVSAAPTDHQAMVGELARLCKKDLAMSAGQIAGTVKKLHNAGYTVEDLKGFLPFWNTQWQSRNGSVVPSIGQVGDMMFASREWNRARNMVKANTPSVDPQVELMRRLKAEQQAGVRTQ